MLCVDQLNNATFWVSKFILCFDLYFKDFDRIEAFHAQLGQDNKLQEEEFFFFLEI